jgi:Uma2 family endonuclease
MRDMTSSIDEYVRAIEHMPESAILILQNVTWDEYDALLKGLDMPGLRARVSYDHGRLDVVTTSPEHEFYVRFIDALVRVFAEYLKVELENFGQTTWRRRILQQGLDPDCCYYVCNAGRIIGNLEIDLDVDPPPDIAVEIDITSDSRSKFHIYAALKIQELWLYNGKKLQLRFYELQGQSYREIDESRALPGLRPSMLAVALEQGKTEGQTAALAAFRKSLA